MFLSYLRKLQLRYEVEVDEDLEAEFLLKAASINTVEDIQALSKHKLGYTGQQKGQKLAKYISSLNNALKNLRHRKKRQQPSITNNNKKVFNGIFEVVFLVTHWGSKDDRSHTWSGITYSITNVPVDTDK
jgi:hypothetical protein